MTKSNRGGARPGAGRPRKKNKDQRVSIQIPPDLLADVDKMAQSQGLSRSAMIVWILRKARQDETNIN